MRHANPLKAGLFIVVSFTIALAIFFGITGTNSLRVGSKEYSVVFDLDEDVNGLTIGSEVRLGGLTVGTVREVDVVHLDTDHPVTRVLFRLPERYPLKRDATLIVQAGVTGLVNLNVTSLGTRAAPLAAIEPPLDGAPSGLALALNSVAGIGGEVTQTLQAWRPRGSAALDQVKTTAATANDTIAQVRAKIDPAYAKFAAVADSTHGAMKNLDEITGDTKGDFRTTMSNLSAVTTTAREKLPALVDRATDLIADVRNTIDKTGHAIEDAQAIAANGREISQQVRALVATNRGRLDETVKSLTFAGQNLAAASSEIRRSPWRLLYKPSEGEVANQNLFDATRQFAEASRRLHDSSVALRDSLADPQVDKPTIQGLLDKLNADFAGYQKVEATLWDRVK